MKAAILKAFGQPLYVEDIPAPTLGTGEVIVDMVASGVLNYANEVFSGERKFLLDLPVVPGPGGIGRVREFGPDATHLAVGDWVYCDPTVRSRDDALNPDITLQGWSAGGTGGLRLQEYFRDASWAQQMRLPTENAIRIGNIEEKDAAAWLAIGTFLVPFGGLLALDLQAGETLVVNGATGGFGGAAVAVALAMGAGCVIATGRNEHALRELERRFGPRVRITKMGGDEQDDRARILQTAAGPIDCVLDLLPPTATGVQVRTSLMTVRPRGRVVLMGGVGEQGGPGLELPYRWLMRNAVTVRGQWMYPPEATARMVRLIHSGLLTLDHYQVTEFDLDRVNEAVAHAAANAGAFQKTVIRF